MDPIAHEESLEITFSSFKANCSSFFVFWLKITVFLLSKYTLIRGCETEAKLTSRYFLHFNYFINLHKNPNFMSFVATW